MQEARAIAERAGREQEEQERLAEQEKLCVVTSSDALHIPDAEVKALAPKRRKCGPILSETRSADEAAAHGIKMKAMAAAEEAEVRPDCVVCCAGVTTSDALQALRREERKREVEEPKQESKRKAKVRPAFAHGLLCKRD